MRGAICVVGFIISSKAKGVGLLQSTGVQRIPLPKAPDVRSRVGGYGIFSAGFGFT